MLGFFCVKTMHYPKTRKETRNILNYDKSGNLDPKDLKTLVEQSLDADKALDIVTIDLDDQMAMADYMIIASGTSSRHVNALAQKLKQRLESRGVKGIKVEGLTQSDWVALDAGDIIIHLFRPEVRDFYNMEKMWCNFQPQEGTGGQISA